MRKFISYLIIIVILCLAGYIYWFYYNTFSDGTRVGKLYKFSHKGNVFKTYEGEMLLPGFKSLQPAAINANFFYFSVTDKDIAIRLDSVQGKEIEVHYTQYRKSLPWRGDNYNNKNTDKGQYIVDKIIAVREATY
jgi:hypothetical protein